jgi:hypothetical protein
LKPESKSQRRPVSTQLDKPCLDHGLKGNSQGYGKRWHDGKKLLAHRVVFFIKYGWWPEAVMHKCDNPRCIEPTHLVGGTRDENNKDRAAKNRSAKAVPTRRKITGHQAATIRERYNPKRDPVNGVSALAREFKVDTQTIYNIVKGRTHFAEA